MSDPISQATSVNSFPPAETECDLRRRNIYAKGNVYVNDFPIDSNAIVMGTPRSGSTQRKLEVAVGELTLLDTGAAGTVTLGLPDLVTAGTYENPSSITVDDSGRVTAFNSSGDPPLTSVTNAGPVSGDPNQGTIVEDPPVDGVQAIRRIYGSTNVNVTESPGAITLDLPSNLSALQGITGTGLIARTGVDTYALRSLQGTNGIIVADGDGVA